MKGILRLRDIFAVTLLGSYLNLNSQVNNLVYCDSLTINADAIVLKNDQTMEVFSKEKIQYHYDQSFLVLNEESREVNQIVFGYDKFQKIEDIAISILTLDGKKVKTIKRKDMNDFSAIDDMTIASDDRYLYYKVKHHTYPYIINVNCKIVSNQSFQNLRFRPIMKKTAIHSSTYTVKNYDLKNKLRFSDMPFIQVQRDSLVNLHIYKWELGPLTVNTLDSLNKSNADLYLKTIIEDFQMDGVSGDFSSWKNIGKWFDKLNNATLELDEVAKNEIKAVIGTETDKSKIINKLYQYLQQNMRYVSIQLGIGGFKPMPAQEVHKNKYGDCKALSNYMKAILNVANIHSTYLVISAGEKNFEPDDDFPENGFNHAILGVPLNGDTIFLECTSKDAPAGYLGSFTGNRKGLCVDGENSGLVRTKLYDHTSNEIITNYTISLQESNDAQVFVKKSMFGMGIDDKKYVYTKNIPLEKFKEMFIKQSNNDIKDLEITKRNYDPYELEYAYFSSSSVIKSGSRIIIPIDQENSPFDLDKVSTLKDNKMTLKYGLTKTDIIHINIPPGCHIEKPVQNQNFDSPYLKIEINAIFNAGLNAVQIERKLIYRTGTFEIGSNKENFKKVIGKYNLDKMVIQCKS